MLNIYLKVTVDTFSKLQFSGFKNLSPGDFFGSSNSRRYQILKYFVATSESEVWKQSCVWPFHYFNFETNYGVLKSKSPCILLYRNINFLRDEPCTSAHIRVAN